MKKIILCLAMRSVFSLVLILCSVVGSLSVNAQVGVGTSTPDAAAALDVSSTTQGLLPPRMTAAQRNSISNPPAGLMLWCSDCGAKGELNVFNGTAFTAIDGSAAAAAPFSTKIGSDIDGEAAGDLSGFSVSLSSNGTIVAIGAVNNDGTHTNAGHVRVYHQNVSGSRTEIGDDIDGEAAGDLSGYSVSLSSDGSIVAIGAVHNDGNGSNAGHVRVYQNLSGSLTKNTSWTKIGSDIDGEAADDLSGYSVSLSSNGSIVAIGAVHNDGNGSNAGHVRVYQNVSGTWTQLGSDIDGEAANDQSGTSVSLSSDGSIVAIGAVHNDGTGSDAGHVRVYQNVSGTWTQLGSDIDGEAANDQSGYSVSLSSDGTIVAIGAEYNDGNGLSSGHVRVYQNVSGTWTQLGGDINGEAAGNRSGNSVSLSGNGTIVAIGASHNDGTNGTESGHVRVYKNIIGTWTQLGSDIDGEAASDHLGKSVSLSGNGTIVAIGASHNDGNGLSSGHVRIYH
jgi:Flp pilus assembly pilin Flp